ncbi:hypothetical protein PR048_010876 [Dryococelus australis]|uniref:Uncharacterized protein n=1 Tax=Dryococelus australis TaxID=614101 RepID=A0ABQ9I3X5_9NEOP|nr:hypothetical protein PR048_010876 [Dryococelus australis]
MSVYEFDYRQNVPIRKLNVTNDFYKGLLWLYTFNVHVNNANVNNVGSPLMYHFIKFQAKKDAIFSIRLFTKEVGRLSGSNLKQKPNNKCLLFLTCKDFRTWYLAPVPCGRTSLFSVSLNLKPLPSKYHHLYKSIHLMLFCQHHIYNAVVQPSQISLDYHSPAPPGTVTAAKINYVSQLFYYIIADCDNFLGNRNDEDDEFISYKNENCVP